MSQHVQLRIDTGLHNCYPHSPWHRGTNENTDNSLPLILNQYDPGLRLTFWQQFGNSAIECGEYAMAMARNFYQVRVGYLSMTNQCCAGKTG